MKRSFSGRLHGSPVARALHEQFPAVDLHADPLMWASWGGYDLTKRHTPLLPGNRWIGHTDLPRFREGGVGAQFFGLVSLPVFGHTGCFSVINRQIDVLEGVAKGGNELHVCRTVEDIAAARAAGAVAGLLGIEGAHALEGNIDNLDHFARRGVRYLGLSHFSANEACCPCVGRGRDDAKGLTRFGEQLVDRCFQHGIIPDLAHINKQGFMEVCDLAVRAGRPVIDSHTGVMGVHEHLRNIDSEQLRAVAETDGVCGVIFAPVYLGGKTIASVVAHINYMVNVMGEEHVALGSDYDGMVTPVPELGDVSMLPNLTDALLRDGWSERRLAKLLRENALRVLGDTPTPFALSQK